MTTEIELYRGKDYVLWGRLPLGDVVRIPIERCLGRKLTDARIALLRYDVPDEGAVRGLPVVRNLLEEFGYADVIVEQDGLILYRHPHPVSELLGGTLQEVLREAVPEETHW